MKILQYYTVFYIHQYQVFQLKLELINPIYLNIQIQDISIQLIQLQK